MGAKWARTTTAAPSKTSWELISDALKCALRRQLTRNFGIVLLFEYLFVPWSDTDASTFLAKKDWGKAKIEMQRLLLHLTSDLNKIALLFLPAKISSPTLFLFIFCKSLSQCIYIQYINLFTFELAGLGKLFKMDLNIYKSVFIFYRPTKIKF